MQCQYGTHQPNPMVSDSHIQISRLKGETVFQDFCLRLAKKMWKDPHAQLHGKRGQSQFGVDIIGKDNVNGYKVAAIQCKGSESNNPRKLKKADLDKEVRAARSFSPKLNLLIIAYAGEPDGALQRRALELSAENEEKGLFKVLLWSWDDVVDQAKPFPDLIQFLVHRSSSPIPSELDPDRPHESKLDAFGKIEAAIASYKAANFDVDVGRTSDDPETNAKIDVFRGQIVAGDGAAVVQPLRKLADELGDNTAPHTRFRAYANLGAALLQQGSTT